MQDIYRQSIVFCYEYAGINIYFSNDIGTQVLCCTFCIVKPSPCYILFSGIFYRCILNLIYFACSPSRNKTLMFAFLNIERASAMEWYKRILVLGLPEPRDLNINPKNTIGTVIALNGHRKYYCLYHAKHPESIFGVR